MMEVLLELDENVPRLISARVVSHTSSGLDLDKVEHETQIASVTFVDSEDGPIGPAEIGSPVPGTYSTGPVEPRRTFEDRTGIGAAGVPSAQAQAKARPTLPFLGDIKNNRAAAASKQIPSLPFLVDIRKRGPANIPHLEEVRKRGEPAGSPVQQHQQLPFLKEITFNWRRKGSVRRGKRAGSGKVESQSASAELRSPMTPLDTSESLGASDLEPLPLEELKKGTLTKSSQHRRKGAHPGPKQKRKFRLTSEALEYFQPFRQVRLRRSYPLISVEDVQYDKKTNPLQFKLVFPNYFLFLQAETQQETGDWVDNIISAWSKWKAPGRSSSTVRLREEDLEKCDVDQDSEDETFTSREPEDTYLDITEPASPDDTTGKTCDPSKDVCLITPPPPLPADDDPFAPLGPPVKFLPGFPAEPLSTIDEASDPSQQQLPRRFMPRHSQSYYRPRAKSSDEAYLHKKASVDLEESHHHRARRVATKKAIRFARLKPPSLERAAVIYDPECEYENALEEIHGNSSMIKYPTALLSLPSEKTFVVDKDNLILMWKNSSSAHFSLKSSLSLRRVVEIRQGQDTVGFNKFPYDQVVDKSFSLLYESESNKFAKLDSIDIICEASDVYSGWIKGLQLLVSSSQWLHIYPPRYEDSDPTILWLKQLWRLKSDSVMEELKQPDAMKLAKSFIPFLTSTYAKLVVATAHNHQLTPTVSHGLALRWDGFVLMFNILCHTNDLQLYNIYLKYAKESPGLGFSLKEFKEFLINECYWSPEDCRASTLHTIMKNYDEHHQAVKKYDAQNKAKDFQKTAKLFSFRGLLSFLRSKNNSIINLEHETVYQDMSQPLSHYFVNSSHNTYLEGDQLTGTSSCDAYVRALLQGCRCVEVDCWDDTLNVNGLAEREPIIYHGHTLTTKVSFRNVIHTIQEYGFHSSFYPIIISIENHCSSTQQVKMAKIFRAIFEDCLPVENLVEKDNRERLPSPEELQGKIILKGSFSEEDRKKKVPKKKTKKVRSQSSAVSMNQIDGPKNSPLTTSQERQIHATKELRKMDTIIADEQDDPFTRFRRGSTRRRNQLEGYIFQKEQGQDDQELTFTETGADLSDLIVYCRSISIKPWSWKMQQQSAVCEMFSFGEPTANELSKKFPRELLCCSERQIVRTYPKGTRFDSSNYDPMPLWACGVQLVALNFQKPDMFMHLNQGFFRNNGGCGYVLKPAVMRCRDPGKARHPYSPNIDVPHPDVIPIDLEIELLSGQKLSPLRKKRSALTVDIMTFGIKHDNSRMKSATHNYNFWPTWGEGEHVLKHTILMPELCLVYFKVELDGKKRLFGQNCFPVISLSPGIKFVPMRTNGGELIPESGLFVRIKKTMGADLRTTSPISGGVESSQQLSNVNTTASLPVGANFLRARFATVHGEGMDMEEEEEEEDTLEELSAPTAKRRVTSPAVLQEHKRNGNVSSSREEATPSLTAASNGVVEVQVEIHWEGNEDKPRTKRKSHSFDA